MGSRTILASDEDVDFPISLPLVPCYFLRYRYDQLMRLGWKVFLPVTIFWLFVEGVAIYLEIGPWFEGVLGNG